MLLRAMLTCLRNQLPIHDFFHLFQMDVAYLIGSNAPTWNVAESWIVDLLLDLLLIVLGLLFLQFQWDVLEDHWLECFSWIKSKQAEGMFPWAIFECIAKILQDILKLIGCEISMSILLEHVKQGIFEPTRSFGKIMLDYPKERSVLYGIWNFNI